MSTMVVAPLDGQHKLAITHGDGDDGVHDETGGRLIWQGLAKSVRHLPVTASGATMGQNMS